MTISSTRPSIVALWMLWGGIGLIAAAAVLSAVSFIAAFNGGFSAGPLIAAVVLAFCIAPLFYVVSFGYFRVVGDRRIRAAAEAYPGAYLLHVVMRPKVAGQFRAAAASLGLTTGPLPWNNYAVFVADATALRLFGGWFSYTERLSIPTSALASVSIRPVVIGIRTLDCVVLGIADAAGAVWPVELLPLRWQGALIRSVPASLLPAELAAMKSATHPGL